MGLGGISFWQLIILLPFVFFFISCFTSARKKPASRGGIAGWLRWYAGSITIFTVMSLLQSVPDLDVDVDVLPSIEGQPPSLDDLPEGCSFAPRCPYAFDKCLEYPPEFLVEEGHVASCWRHHGD